MVNTLKYLGFMLIFLGILGAALIVTEIDWNTTQTALALTDNPLADFQIAISKAIINTQIASAIFTGFSGIISGIFFLALASIVDYLESISIALTNEEE